MSTQIEALLRKSGTALNWLMLASGFATIAWVSFRTIEDEMIKDQSIGSARAEKDHANSRIIQSLMTALLASALTLPLLAAWGTERSPEQPTSRAGDVLPLPPIRYLDSMPWLNWKASAPILRIDTLMSPTITPWGVLKSPQDPTSSALS